MRFAVGVLMLLSEKEVIRCFQPVITSVGYARYPTSAGRCGFHTVLYMYKVRACSQNQCQLDICMLIDIKDRHIRDTSICLDRKTVEASCQCMKNIYGAKNQHKYSVSL